MHEMKKDGESRKGKGKAEGGCDDLRMEENYIWEFKQSLWFPLGQNNLSRMYVHVLYCTALYCIVVYIPQEV